MASGSKTTAVHFTLIFFVMLSVILGVVSYMYYDEDKTIRAQSVDAKNAADKAKSVAIKAESKLRSFQQGTGYLQPEVGEGDNPGDGTARGAMAAEMKSYGVGFNGKTLSDVIKQMNQSLSTITKDRDAKDIALNSINTQMATLRNQYDSRVKVEIEAKGKAEKDRDSEQTSKEEAIEAKDTQISTLQSNFSKVQLEIEQIRDEFCERKKYAQSKNPKINCNQHSFAGKVRRNKYRSC